MIKLTSACNDCPIYGATMVRGRGMRAKDGTVDVLFIGEAPGREEKKQGKAFVGPSGEILQRAIDSLVGVPHWVTNIVKCFIPLNKKKDKIALGVSEHCKDALHREIEILKPRVIITLGNIPTKALFPRAAGITKERGKLRWLNGTPVIPTLHPAYILRAPTAYQDWIGDVRKAVGLLSKETVVTEAPTIQHTVTDDWREVLRKAEANKFAVLDLETTGLDMHRDDILCVVIGLPNNSYIIPGEVMHRGDFINALNKSTARWSGHNAKFDRNFIKAKLGIDLKFQFDTMLAHYLLDERRGQHDLKGIVGRLWDVPNWELPVQAALKRAKSKSYGDIPTDELHWYAAQDGYWQYRLTEHLAEKIRANGKFVWLFQNLLMPGMHALSDAEVVGVNIDIVRLRGNQRHRSLISEFEEKCAQIEADLHTMAGHEFNPRSPQQVAAVMFDEMHLPKMEGRSTNAKTVLSRLGYNPFVRKLLEYRQHHKIFSTYIKGIDQRLSPDGAIHTTYNLHGTATGRLSSSNPNLQNIPNRTELSRQIEHLFMARSGKMFSYVDYSQLEYRCIGWLSDDPFLLECYKEGRDLHSEMARLIFGDDFTQEQRTIAKVINFKLLYGGSLAGVSTGGLGAMSVSQRLQVQRNFFARFVKVRQHIRGIRRSVAKDGYIESPLGRRRRFPFLPTHQNTLEEVYREAVNMPPQSMASDLTLYSFIKLWKEGYHPIITVHDSIIIEEDERYIEEAALAHREIMVECGTELYGTKVPFGVDGMIVRRWGEVH